MFSIKVKILNIIVGIFIAFQNMLSMKYFLLLGYFGSPSWVKIERRSEYRISLCQNEMKQIIFFVKKLSEFHGFLMYFLSAFLSNLIQETINFSSSTT